MSVVTKLYTFDQKKADKELEKCGKDLEYLCALKASVSDDEEFTCELINDYLESGASNAINIESPVGVEQHMTEINYIVYYFNKYASVLYTMNNDCNIPRKKSLIKIYSEMNVDILNKIIENFAINEEQTYGFSKEHITNTLKYLQPLAKALKENRSLELVVSFDYDYPNVSPEEFNILVKKKINKIKKQIDNNSEINTAIQNVSYAEDIYKKI